MKSAGIKFVIASLACCLALPAAAEWRFTEVAEESGIAYEHDYIDASDGFGIMAAGAAVGDYDLDGDLDIYLITGDARANALLRNNGNGSFTNVTDQAAVAMPGHRGSGPVFAHFNGDGWPDLGVGGIAGSGYYLFRNNRDGSFQDVTAASGVVKEIAGQNDFSTAFGDVDQDGDLDMFISHWGAEQSVNHLWINDGLGTFLPNDLFSDIRAYEVEDWTFSPIFTDINADGRTDLLVSGDFGTSQVFINAGGGRFNLTTQAIIDDENGMGTTVGDFDNDGDQDWFVTSIYDEDDKIRSWGDSGNRLYANDGSGGFSNVTTSAGVRKGYWGWGACAADFNNDGWLDIFHVNGMPAISNYADYNSDPSRLFLNNKDGSFTESSGSLGILERDQGRGVVCFDYDMDGDIDILTSNYFGRSKLYRNDLQTNPGYLQIRLHGNAPNTQAVGAVITLEAGGLSQYREVVLGSNYVSQNPLVQHFGLDGAQIVDRISIRWPDGQRTTLRNVQANRMLNIYAAVSCLNRSGAKGCRRKPQLDSVPRIVPPPRADGNGRLALDRQ